MKKISILAIAIASVSLSYQAISAEINVLRTDTGFYYPANKKHSDSIFFGYGDKNPFFANRCHLANDYNLTEGSPIYATGEGEVIQANLAIPFYGSDSGTPGGAMIVKHTTDDGAVFYALYGHVKNFVFNVGDSVKAGEKIAEVGPFLSNNNSIPHLHFGINSQVPSFQAYTPTGQCTDFLGYVDPEVFITSNPARVVAAETCMALDDSVSTIKNTIINSISVLTNDSDTDGDILSVASADANSANGVAITNNNDGTFTYTPSIDFIGTDSFSYTVTDNNGCTDKATVNITVNSDSTSTVPSTSSSSGGFFSLVELLSALSLLLFQSFKRRK